ncbi:MAG: exodeoxyribonuclease III [Proteobacteria bacterium]|nr:exodeoxyribonuclease III [Pseudomonadota bacterium]
MKIATWNVNSITVRLPHVLDYLRAASPDVLLLQELKAVDEAFPDTEIGDAGYNCAVWGQRTYNGVAILSKTPLDDIQRGLPGDEDEPQARYIEAETNGIRVASIYLPNGNPVDGPKFPYKLSWMDRLIDHAAALLETDSPFVLGGDYNVCPADADVYDPADFADDALCRPESRSRFRALVNLGLTEAFRALHPDETGAYSYWGYQGGAWRKGHGLRIDHLLLSPHLSDRLVECEIDREPRAREKASDHTPVWCELSSGERDDTPWQV